MSHINMNGGNCSDIIGCKVFWSNADLTGHTHTSKLTLCLCNCRCVWVGSDCSGTHKNWIFICNNLLCGPVSGFNECFNENL